MTRSGTSPQVSVNATSGSYARTVSASPSASPPPRRPVDRSALRLGAWLYEELKSQLLEGRYAAGERLSVEDIRLQFGVSKQPVMEAMRRLASDGLVRITPQVGCEVASYEPLEVADFFRLFGSFEAAIAEVAAERRTAEQLQALDEVSRRVDALGEVADPVQRVHAYRLLNREFHGVIHEMAQSTIMVEASQRMWDLSDFLINTTGLATSMDTGLDHRQQDHDRIRDALAAGDGAAARREMEQHIADTLRPSRS